MAESVQVVMHKCALPGCGKECVKVYCSPEHAADHRATGSVLWELVQKDIEIRGLRARRQNIQNRLAEVNRQLENRERKRRRTADDRKAARELKQATARAESDRRKADLQALKDAAAEAERIRHNPPISRQICTSCRNTGFRKFFHGDGTPWFSCSRCEMVHRAEAGSLVIDSV